MALPASPKHDLLSPPVSLSWPPPKPAPPPPPPPRSRSASPWRCVHSSLRPCSPSRGPSPHTLRAPSDQSSIRSRSRSPLGSATSRSSGSCRDSCCDLADGGANDFSMPLNARRIIRRIRRYRHRSEGNKEKESTDVSLCPRNEAYSLQDAVVVLSSTVRHLSVLFASVSYVRLRLQGRPVDLPLDQRYAGTSGLAALSKRALRQADLLRTEIQFLQQFTQKLDEADSIVPADVIVEKKDSVPSYTITSIVVVTAATVVFIYKLKYGPPSLVWWWC